MAEYVTTKHPVLGDIQIRADLAESMSGAELNDLIIKTTAKRMQEEGLEISGMDAFTENFMREFSSTSRGLQELATGERTTDVESDFLTKLAFETNTGTSVAGIAAGALADPVTLPIAFTKLLKLGKLATVLGGAASGATLGAVQPVREEYGEDAETFAKFGAVAGGILTLPLMLLPKLAAKYGAKDASELQKIFDSKSPDEQNKMLEDMQYQLQAEVSPQISNELPSVVKSDAVESVGYRQDFEEALARQQADTAKFMEENQARFDFEQNLQRERDASLNFERQKMERNAYDANVQMKMDDLRAEVAQLPTAKQSKIIQNTVKESEKYIKKMTDRLNNVQKAINKINSSNASPKKKKVTVEPLRQERNKLKRDIDVRTQQLVQRDKPLADRIDFLKQAKQELKTFDSTGVVPESVRMQLPESPRSKDIYEGVTEVQQPTLREQPVREEVQPTTPQLQGQPTTLAEQTPISSEAPMNIPMPTQAPSVQQVAGIPTVPAGTVPPAGVAKTTAQPDVSPTPRVSSAEAPTVPDKGTVGKFFEDVFGALSTKLARFAPEIVQALRRYESVVMQKVAEYTNPTEPFFNAIDKMSPSMRKAMKGHLYSGRFAEAEAMMNADMRKQFRSIRSSLEKVHKELKDAGIPVDRLDNYFPRKVKDLQGLRSHLGRVNKDKITKALEEAVAKNKKPLSPEQEEAVINKVVRDIYRPKDPTRRGNTAKRSLQGDLPDEVLEFYHEPKAALTMYYRNMVEMAEKAKFFGRNKQLTAENTLNVEDSIGATIRDIRMKRNLSEQQYDDLKAALEARFNEGEQAPHGILRATRDFGYMGTIGNFASAIVNLGDLGTSGALHGFIPTIQAAFGGKANKYKVVEMGIDHTIAHELQDTTKTAKALQKIFKLSGFRDIDRFAKETSMNAAMKKNESLAKSDTGKAKLREKWGKFFGDETESLINDLEKGNISENTKLLAFHELSDMQPISLTEMPQSYLKHPNGRIFYMLKSFTLKQLDIVRRNVVQEAAKGNVFTATKNMALLAGYLAAANTGTQVVKDFIMQRDIEPELIPDQAIWNVLGVFGANKYVMDRYLSQGDVKGAVMNTIFPATPISDSATQLVKETGKALKGEDYNLMKASRAVPIVGPILYNWFGGAKENYNERLAGQLADKRYAENPKDWIVE